jgi:hypothetical protein
MFVILSPSPVILSEAKNLDFWLRTGSVKNLRETKFQNRDSSANASE